MNEISQSRASKKAKTPPSFYSKYDQGLTLVLQYSLQIFNNHWRFDVELEAQNRKISNVDVYAHIPLKTSALVRFYPNLNLVKSSFIGTPLTSLCLSI